MTLTLQYRLADTIPNLQSAGWTTLSPNAPNGVNQKTSYPLGGVNASYIQYQGFFTTTTPYNLSPMINEIDITYPSVADFAITGMSAPQASSVQTTQVITYWVENKASTLAPIRPKSAASSSKAPTKPAGRFAIPPPPQFGNSPNRATAPQAGTPPTYLFYITFYANRSLPGPTGPNDLTSAMTCYDYNNPLHPTGNYPPFIYYNYELGKTPVVFYAQCTVPGNATNFWGQIDTCSSSDPYCTTVGYVLERDESPPPSFLDNIIGPLSPGGTISGGGGGTGLILFLPYIKR